jgi:putative Mn2+ efflux pump MntP
MLRKAYQETRSQNYSFREAKRAMSKEAVTEDSCLSLLLLATSVSMDALTVGFSLGTIQTPIAYAVLIIGLVAGTMTFLGFMGGKIFSSLVGSYAQFFGGLILLGLAIKMVV